jgi:methionyl-tRNA formyltransferase
MAAFNLHFSLLPSYRGANPAEWALIRGETETGVTLIEMSPTFDTGKMIAQSGIAVTETDTRESIYQKLYELGGEVLPAMLVTYDRFRQDPDLEKRSSASPTPITFFLPPKAQGTSPTPYAQRLVRDDGFISWSALRDAQAGGTADSQDLSAKLSEILHTTELKADGHFIERVIRALAGFPGVWTMVETAKGLRRLKILSAHLVGEKLILDRVQLEGQAPAAWTQAKSAIIFATNGGT